MSEAELLVCAGVAVSEEALCCSVSVPSSLHRNQLSAHLRNLREKGNTIPERVERYLHTEVLRAWTSTNTAGIGDTDIILHSVKVFQITLCHVIQSYFDQYNTKGILKLFLHFCFII